MTQFIDFVKEGGSLTVIDTDGKGSLYDFLKDHGAISREGDSELNDNNLTSKVYFTKVGKGEIQYIDIFPTINDIENGYMNITSLYDISKYLDVSGFSSNEFKMGQVKAVFDDLSASGNISAIAQSLIFPSKIPVIAIRI